MLNAAALVLKALQDANLNAVADLPQAAARPIQRWQENGVFGPSSQMPDHLWQFDFQVDTWGTTKSDALALVSGALTLLRGHPSNAHGQVTRVELVGHDYQPDPDWPQGPQPGPRYISIFRIHAHPAA